MTEKNDTTMMETTYSPKIMAMHETERGMLLNLWEQFEHAPIDPVFRTLLQPYTLTHRNKHLKHTGHFQKGDQEAALIAWIEKYCKISVHEDLGYNGPCPGRDGCSGCVHEHEHAWTQDGLTFHPRTCASCSRYANRPKYINNVRDRYLFKSPTPKQDAEGKPPLTAKPAACGDVVISVNAPFEIRVTLTENDIFNWLTQCTDLDTLLRLSDYVKKCASNLQERP